MSEKKRVLYRGVPMIEGWPERIQEAQHNIAYKIGGETYPMSNQTGMQMKFHAMTVVYTRENFMLWVVT